VNEQYRVACPCRRQTEPGRAEGTEAAGDLVYRAVGGGQIDLGGGAGTGAGGTRQAHLSAGWGQCAPRPVRRSWFR